MVLVNVNAYILQSTWWNFLKFLPHVFKSSHYKILRLYVSKMFFSKNLVVVLEMAILERFW